MHAPGQRPGASRAGRLSSSAGARLAALLDWMAGQDFEPLVAGGLLRDVEEAVVQAYVDMHPGRRRPDAYHWLRYEDPAPVHRLADGVRKLRKQGARFDLGAVDKACNKASKAGYLN